MNRQRIILTALPLLAAVLVFVWLPNLSRFSGGDRGSPVLAAADTKKLKEIRILIKNSSVAKKGTESGFAEWGRDPFYKTAEASVPVPADPYPLQGIFYDDINPSALIGGTVVFVGEKIDDNFTVTNILPDMVVISDGRKVIRLQLKDSLSP